MHWIHFFLGFCTKEEMRSFEVTSRSTYEIGNLIARRTQMAASYKAARQTPTDVGVYRAIAVSDWEF